MPMVYEMETWSTLAHPSFEPEATIRSLDDYLEALRRYVVRVQSEEAVGVEDGVQSLRSPQPLEALAAFERLRSGGETRLPVPNPLRDYVVDQTIAFASSRDLVTRGALPATGVISECWTRCT